MKKENKEVVKDCVVLGGSGRQWLEDKWQRRDIGHQPSHPQWATCKLRLALIDTHIFKLNEYFVELNPANFKVLN